MTKIMAPFLSSLEMLRVYFPSHFENHWVNKQYNTKTKWQRPNESSNDSLIYEKVIIAAELNSQTRVDSGRRKSNTKAYI
jgi:hypothetical protein